MSPNINIIILFSVLIQCNVGLDTMAFFFFFRRKYFAFLTGFYNFFRDKAIKDNATSFKLSLSKQKLYTYILTTCTVVGKNVKFLNYSHLESFLNITKEEKKYEKLIFVFI